MEKTLSRIGKKTQNINGLCVNCGERHRCQFPSFGKNVIHCEEYYCCCPNERVSYRKSHSFGQTLSFGINNWI